ncbi:HAD family hydrolase [Flavitalea flava]
MLLIYKHYSFDLWMTLIRSNPLFKREKAIFFHKNFNEKNKTVEEIAAIFRQVDLLCNAINEKTGKNIDAEEMYLMVISIMNDYNHTFSGIDLTKLYDDMEGLFFTYRPHLFDEQTLKVLRQLKEKRDPTFSLLSNTAFIKGRTLRKILPELGLDQIFDFQLYSDEEGLSKPNKVLFTIMLDKIHSFRPESDRMTSLQEIVHIGDNEKADRDGAIAAGISALVINSNDKSILSLVN